MAYRCVRVAGRDCDGCGKCGLWGGGRRDEDTCEDVYAAPPPLRCEECGGEAADDGYYYDVEGTILCGGCVDKLFRKDVTE